MWRLSFGVVFLLVCVAWIGINGWRLAIPTLPMVGFTSPIILQPTATPIQPTPTPNPPTPTTISAADIAERVGRSVVLIKNVDISGSGVKIAQGVLTNAHVVGGARQVRILTQDGREAVGFVVRRDPTVDLALVLADLSLPSVDIERAQDQRQGDSILVLGYPRSDAIGGQATLTRGLISAFRDDPTNNRLLVQTDAAINPGSSGGPMVNLRGNLVGLVTEQLRDSQGLSFGIASETIGEFLARPVATPRPTALPTALPRPPPTEQPLDATTLILTAADLNGSLATPDWVEMKMTGRLCDNGASSSFTRIGASNGEVDSDACVYPEHLSGKSRLLSTENLWVQNHSVTNINGLGDYADGLSQIRTPFVTDVLVQVVLKNVYIGVRIQGPPKLANLENATKLARIIVGRLQ